MSKIVFRTLDVFEVFAAQRRPLSLTDLARLLDVPPSSCHDVLHALEERGYLYEVRPRGGFYPTKRLFELARVIAQHDPLAARAEAVLERLSLALQASISLGRINGHQLTYLLVCNPPDPLRFSVEPGANVRNLYATSAGKALLGSLPAGERKAVVDAIELKPMTKHTITSRRALLEEVKQSEARGWFVNREESVEDALTISTRFAWSGAAYVITASGTVNRMERQWDQALAALREAATELGS